MEREGYLTERENPNLKESLKHKGPLTTPLLGNEVVSCPLPIRKDSRIVLAIEQWSIFFWLVNLRRGFIKKHVLTPPKIS